MSEESVGKNAVSGAVLLLADNALEKLKLCDYDVEYCRRKNVLPFHPVYFTEPAANTSSQWAALVGLVSWIINESGQEFKVDKYDDPNTTANKLMLTLKQLGLETDFPVTRIKQGYGEAVCTMLDFLAGKLLKKRGFKFQEPIYPETDGFEEAEVDEVADLGAQEDIVDEAIESEEEDGLYTENVRGNVASRKGGNNAAEQKRGEMHEERNQDKSILTGEQSAEFVAAWQAELERVAPKLKRSMEPSGNEWRSHLMQVKSHEETIQKVLPDAISQLEKINADLTEGLERISSKEMFLSNSFEQASNEYRSIQEKLKVVSVTLEERTQVVEKLSAELDTVTEALDELKGDMDSRGNSMVDTSPLQKIRKALAKLKAEIKDMELRIGVVGHSLLQASLREATEVRLAKKTAGSAARGAGSPLGTGPISPTYEAF